MKHYFTRIEESMKKYWKSPILTNYKGNSFTFEDIARHVEKFHIVFDKIGVNKGDKIALCGHNCAEWGMAFLGATTYEAVCVPLLNDFPPESVQTLTNHAEARILFTDSSVWEKIDKDKMPLLEAAISLDDFSILWAKEGNLKMAKDSVDGAFDSKFPNGLKPEDINYPVLNFDEISVINYTSGTTSAPKGVMVTNRSLSSNIEFGEKHIPHRPGDTLVSMLPLAHMFGLVFEFLYQISAGSHVFFLGKIPSPKVLLQAFQDVKPYMLITVPLVIEKIFKSSVFPVVKKPSIRRLMKIPFLNNIIKTQVRRSILTAFGGKMRVLVAGGAAINQEVEWWMRYVKLPYTIGYGMTECGPLIAYQDPDKFVQCSCGVIIDRMAVRIDSEDPQHIVGEIQVQGDNVMRGYYKNEEATKATFTEDGWLRTGDLGLLDRNGDIFIKGRSKNMILTSNGQNVYPEEIEDKLNNQPYIVESVVLERDKQIIALVFPDQDRISQEQLDSNGVAKIMEENRVNINLLLPQYSRISKIEMMDNEFEKTPKRSIKRYLYK
ncbi:MAG: AMP-binding protein [Bacteroidales bacterium]|nr:AMP-binding protein [Bacteroidales bacterium]